MHLMAFYAAATNLRDRATAGPSSARLVYGTSEMWLSGGIEPLDGEKLFRQATIRPLDYEF